jgi:hypothetical protein
MHTINTNTLIAVGLFALAYLAFVARKTARQQLDLYDFVMLSTVAVVPAVFVFWPGLAYWLAEIAGVAFPFVIMFGALFLILFLFVYRMTAKMHRLERDNLLLIQEISLLRLELGSRAAEKQYGQRTD